MQLKTLLLTASTLLTAATTAHAGVPAWCKTTAEIDQASIDDVRSADVRYAVNGVAYLTCHPDQQDAGTAPEIAATRQKLSARLGLTEADWADAAEWATAPHRTAAPPPNGRAWSTLSALDQFAVINDPLITTDTRKGNTDAAYVTDAMGARLSQAGRVAYLTHCLRGDAEPVEWAMCQGDVEAFDPRALAAELHADRSHDGFERMWIRFAADDVRNLIGPRAAAIKALIAKDPAYAKMFELAAATRAMWKAHAGEWTEALALASSMEDALVTQSRKASQGCAERGVRALKAAIANIPATRFGAAPALDPAHWYRGFGIEVITGPILSDPQGYLAASSLAMCAGVEKMTDIGTAIRAFGGSLSRLPGHRGPRNSVETAILMAGLTFDDRATQLQYPEQLRFWLSGTDSPGATVGHVTSAKPQGAKVSLTFEHKPEQVRMSTNCHDGAHPVAIRGNGELVYESYCTGSELVTVQNGPPTTAVNAATAQGVQKGMVVLFDSELWAAWPKVGATGPSFVLGVAVK